MHKIEQEKDVVLGTSKLANLENLGGVENVKIVSLKLGPSFRERTLAVDFGC